MNRVLIALLAGLGIGIGIAMSGNAALARIPAVIEPVGLLWVNAIRMTIVPLVVSLLVTGIASSRLDEMRRLGGRTFLVFVGLLIVAAVFSLTVVPALFSAMPMDAQAAESVRTAMAARTQQASEQLRRFPTFADWLTGLLPVNPVKAAADGNMLPLVLFTVLFAIAITRIKTELSDAILRVFDAVAETMLTLVRWIIAVAPIGVFALILPVAARLGLSAAGAIGFYVIMYPVAMVLFTVVLYPIATVGGRIGLGTFSRGVFPAQSVALSSSSSLASLPALIDGAVDRLTIPRAEASVVLPLAVSAFKVATPISWVAGALFLGRLYGVPVSAASLGSIALAAVLLSFSTPGVPNGAFLLLAPLLASAGIPPGGVGILIAVDGLPDLIATALNVTGDMTVAVILSRRARLTTAPRHAA
jgi:proton glutamate symport protein